MDLGLTEIQQMLKTSAQEFLSRECPLTLVREMEEDPQGYTDGLWRQMIGWFVQYEEEKLRRQIEANGGEGA